MAAASVGWSGHLPDYGLERDQMVHKVALLTAGGFAPCLSSAIGGLIEKYTEVAPEVEIIAYKNGYQGLLTGDFFTVTPRSAPRPHCCTTSAAPPSATPA